MSVMNRSGEIMASCLMPTYFCKGSYKIMSEQQDFSANKLCTSWMPVIMLREICLSWSAAHTGIHMCNYQLHTGRYNSNNNADEQKLTLPFCFSSSRSSFGWISSKWLAGTGGFSITRLCSSLFNRIGFTFSFFFFFLSSWNMTFNNIQQLSVQAMMSEKRLYYAFKPCKCDIAFGLIKLLIIIRVISSNELHYIQSKLSHSPINNSITV